MLTRRTTLALLASAIALPAYAMEPKTFQTAGVAINGYDPVAYFTQSMAVLGDSAYVADWNGAAWHFASAENRDMFVANPEQYAPQYGGYCAYAASKNALAPTVPEAWTIHNGKLYLNFSLQVRDIWSRDKDASIVLADGFWPDIPG